MLRIVLVEDNPADAEMLKRALERAAAGTEIKLFEDGAKALDYLTAESRNGGRPCDLAVLDLNLPGLNGFAILERIRSSETLRGLPVVVMSGSSDPSEVARSYAAGANSYICKPAHLDEIYQMAAHFVAYWSKCAQLPTRRPMASLSAAVLRNAS